MFGNWCVCFGVVDAPALGESLCHKSGLESGIFSTNEIHTHLQLLSSTGEHCWISSHWKSLLAHLVHHHVAEGLTAVMIPPIVAWALALEVGMESGEFVQLAEGDSVAPFRVDSHLIGLELQVLELQALDFSRLSAPIHRMR
ncbi:hypothetical protein OUZ56_029809 [Daphnia magna]|uniref:Uncharacterized protein n=1 Tax=Daphnia magna TaxID=35525 RepID=A0ABR0B7W5_9CRUS|nr:hypothetical protein OUZ56_029809 [Daphnia magna]